MLDNKIYEDYFNFFTGNQLVDMLPYAYMGIDSVYDEMILTNQYYYLFKDEVEIIKNHHDLLKSHFQGISDVIEIGPGSYYAIEHKTLVLIKNAPHIKHYHALDISGKSLEDACNFIKRELPNLLVSKIVVDITKEKYLKVQNIKGKKAIFLLGSTIGNFDIAQQYYIVRQISDISTSEDLFVITADTNNNIDSLTKAYSHPYTKKFVSGILKYFAEINPAFKQHTSNFEIECEWNNDAGLIDICFIATSDIVFNFSSDMPMTIPKNKKLYGIKSRKFTPKKIENLLNVNNFKIVDILNNSDKMRIFIAKKKIN